MGFWDDIAKTLAGALNPANIAKNIGATTEITSGKEHYNAGGAPSAMPAKKSSKSKKKSTSKSTAETAAQAEEQLANSPWSQIGQALVTQLQQEQAPVEAALSGALTQPAEQSALNTAMEAAGVAPGSASSAWVKGEAALGQQEADPLQAALASYGTAYAAGQQGVDQALTNLGQANQTAINTAPESEWLNQIAQHPGADWYVVPPTVASSLPPAVAQALQQAGFQGITTPKGGWGPNALPSTGASSIAGALSGVSGTAPSSATPNLGTGTAGYSNAGY